MGAEVSLDGGVDFWETLGTGFGNGAQVRSYRLQDVANRSLAFKDVLADATGADHVAFLGEDRLPEPNGTLTDGGFMPSGRQRVYVDADLGLEAGDDAFLVLKRAEVPKAQMHSRVQRYYNGNFSTLSFSGNLTASLVPHPGTLPEAFAMQGEPCMRLTATGSTAPPARAIARKPTRAALAAIGPTRTILRSTSSTGGPWPWAPRRACPEHGVLVRVPAIEPRGGAPPHLRVLRAPSRTRGM